MNRKERLAAIATKLRAFDAELNGANEERLAQIETETRSLKEEQAKLLNEERAELRSAFERGIKPEQLDARRVQEEMAERQYDDLVVNKRAITLDGNLTVLHVTHEQDSINQTFNQVSDLVNRVRFKQFINGETYKEPYMKGYGMAGITAEGTAYTDTEPVWGYAEITKNKLTTYTEVSEEFTRLGKAAYMAEVKKNLSIAIRKKLAQQIVIGTGGTNGLTGISIASQPAIETAKDFEVVTIDENTLDDIVLSYGGDEDVEDGVLVLNKEDLRAFKAVKSTTTKKSAYEIDYKNKTINGVPYVINSNAKALSAAATTAGQYTMFYGSLSAYVIAQFSNLEVQESRDYKFKEGMIAYKVSGFFGGNVAMWNGFLRIKKKAAPAG